MCANSPFLRAKKQITIFLGKQPLWSISFHKVVFSIWGFFDNGISIYCKSLVKYILGKKEEKKDTPLLTHDLAYRYKEQHMKTIFIICDGAQR